MVRMVLNGKVNKDIVGLINRYGPYAVGLSGEDANLFTAARKHALVDGEPVDIGLVGDIVATDPSMVRALLDDGRIPVVSSVARGDGDGAVYNVNADTAAAALAVALGAAKLVVLTDVEGLYLDWPASDEVISQLDADDLAKLLPSLSAGMIPKMEACLTAVEGGVPRAHVLDGRLSHAILLEIFTDSGIGTMVIPADTRRRRPVSESEALRQRFEAAMMVNYGTPPLALARGEGSRVWDADGNRYLDLIAGIAVSALGHAHPAIVDAVTAQVGRHRAHQQPVPARARGPAGREAAGPAARDAHGGARVFFCNSGTEANEAALKLVRRQQGKDRPVDRRRRPQLPRPHDGRARDHRQGVDQGPVRPVRLRRPLGRVRRRRRPRQAVDERHRRRRPRADPGRGRRHPRPGRLPRRRPRGLRRGRRAAGARRDPVGHRPHRRVVRAPGRGGHPRRAHAGQGPRRRAADRRLRRLRRQRHRPRNRRPRLDVRRQPDRLRRRPRRPRHDRGRRPARERQARGRGPRRTASRRSTTRR